MKQCYIFLFAILFLAACSPSRIQYLGGSHAPTKNVDVFVDASAIKRSYTVVGRGYLPALLPANLERMQAKAVKKAKSKGADAILFQDLLLLTDGSHVAVTDSAGRPVRTVAANPVLSTKRDILFLKYN